MKLGMSVFAGIFFMVFSCLVASAEDKVIKEGSKVSFDYTLTVKGEVVDTSKGKEPLQYVQGSHQIIPGLEREMIGLKIGDEKSVVVQPKEAYGEVEPKAYKEIPRSSLPKEQQPQVGMMLEMSDDKGNTMLATISEVKDDAVVLNFNHPLAGKTLNFKVKVVSIE